MRFGYRRLVLYPCLVAALLLFTITEISVVLDHQRPETTDFQATIWQPARNVLDGASPYPDLSTSGFRVGVYPPSAFLPALPLAALAIEVSVVIFQALLVVAALLTLWVLGVRDWRCYGLWATCALVVIPVLIGNATLLVVLCAALLWRFRDTPWAAACALAAAVAVKLFLAPLFLWLLVTRRYRAAAYTVAITPALIFGAWGVIGFEGLSAYPERLHALGNHWGGDGALIHGLARQAGLGSDEATSVGVLVALVLFVLGWNLRSREVAAFGVISAAALALTPVGWPFYAAVLVVPLAVTRPEYSPAWLTLTVFWIHWWYSPLPFRSLGLSAATIAAACLLLVVGVTAQSRREQSAVR